MNKKYSKKRWAACIVTIIVIVAIAISFLMPGVTVAYESNNLSITIGFNESTAGKLPNHPNKIVDYPNDLSGADWANESTVGLELSSNELPSNVVVYGQPLLEGTQLATMDMNRGCFSWTNQAGLKVFDAFPRVSMGNQNIYLNSVIKIPKYDKVLEKTNISYNGTNIGWLDVAVDYDFGIWGSECKDSYGFKLNFTVPIDTLPFNYEYVFLLDKSVDAILFQERGESLAITTNTTIDPLRNGGKDLPDSDTGTVYFVSNGEILADYNYSELLNNSLNAYWDTGKTVVDGSNQIAFTLGFSYPALRAGETFHNDGYFGDSGGTNTYGGHPAGYHWAGSYSNDAGDGTLTKVEFLTNGSVSGTAYQAVYDDNGGVPDNRLAVGTSQTIVDGWNESSTLNLAVTDSTTYWLSFIMSASNPLVYNTGVSQEYRNMGSYVQPPDPFGSSSTDGGGKYVHRAYVVTTPAASISQSPSSKAFGAIRSEYTNWSYGSEPSWPLTDGDAFFYIYCDGSANVSISVNATNPTGGAGATLVMGTPGSDEVRLSIFKEGDGSTDNITLLDGTPYTLIDNMGPSDNTSFEIKLETGTSSETVPTPKTFHIYFLATAL